MEFSWHRNVFTYGVGFAGATVAARVLEPLGRILTNENTDSGIPFASAYLVLGTGEIVASGPFPISAAHPHFPYGYSVEPNVPV